MAKREKPPILRGKQLTWIDRYANQESIAIGDIVSEAQRWQRWLADPHEKSFRFIAPDDRSISVRKEPRPYFEREGETIDVWYAYKTINRRRTRLYLGKSANVTYDRLVEAVDVIYDKLSTT